MSLQEPPDLSLVTDTYLPTHLLTPTYSHLLTPTQGLPGLIQNVMTPSLQILNAGLASILPGVVAGAAGTSNQGHHGDSQVNWTVLEAEKCFEKGYTKLVEEYMFKLQRDEGNVDEEGEDEAQEEVYEEVHEQVHWQVQEPGGRHGGANL